MSETYKQDADLYVIAPFADGSPHNDTISKLGKALREGGAEVIYTEPSNDIGHVQDPFIQVAPGIYAYAAGPNGDRELNSGYLALKKILEDNGGIVVPIPVEYGLPSDYEALIAEGLVELGSEEAGGLSKEREAFSVLDGGNFIFDAQRNLLLVGDDGSEEISDGVYNK